MEVEFVITSNSNAQVKLVTNLLNKSKARRENNSFVVEGIRMVLETPRDRLVKIFVSESFVKSHPNGCEDIKWDNSNVETVADSVFKQMSDTMTPQGIMAIVTMQLASLSQIATDDAFIMICEDLQDPGNLGTIIRTAEGAGATGVILSKKTVDIYNPKTIRSTMGSLYRVPFIYTENLAETINQLKLLNVKIFATHLDGKNTHTGEDYTGKCAFLIGNEGNGLSDEISSMADCLIKIPMAGKVESLNAAVSAAVIMYEVNRQRN